MARGKNLLINNVGATRRSSTATSKPEEQKKKPTGGNLLGAGINPRLFNMFVADPAEPAMQKAREILKEMKAGNFQPLVMAMQVRDFRSGEFPAFDLIFSEYAKGATDALLRKNKVPRRGKEAKAERERLEDLSWPVLGARIFQAYAASTDQNDLQERSSYLKDSASIDESTLIEAALLNEEGGPAKDKFIGMLSYSNFEDLSPSILALISERGAPADAKAAFDEISRRNVFSFVENVLNTGYYRNKETSSAELAQLQRSYRRAPTIHVVPEGTDRTVCGKHSSAGGVKHGAWRDAGRGDSYKRCRKCEKEMPEDTRLRLEAERSDNGESILSLESQKELNDLACDAKVKAIVRKGLREKKPSKDIQTDVNKYLYKKIGKIYARSADEAVTKPKERKGSVKGAGGYHVLWDYVEPDVKEQIKEAGYHIPTGMFYYLHRSKEHYLDKNHDDLLDLIPKTERQQAAALIIDLKDGRVRSSRYGGPNNEKITTIVNRAIRRTLRNKRKGSVKQDTALFDTKPYEQTPDNS